MIRALALLLAVVALASPLACGKKAPPDPPPDSTYPRSYPP